jgi:hypothetical protein
MLGDSVSSLSIQTDSGRVLMWRAEGGTLLVHARRELGEGGLLRAAGLPMRVIGSLAWLVHRNRRMGGLSAGLGGVLGGHQAGAPVIGPDGDVEPNPSVGSLYL